MTVFRPDTKSLPILEPGDRLLMNNTMTCPAETFLENTKRNTPELERKNMLDKIKDMKDKGREFMHRITTNDPIEDRSMVEMKNRTDKNMFFTDEELKGALKVLLFFMVKSLLICIFVYRWC